MATKKTSTKKSIDTLKKEKVDGKNVKGGSVRVGTAELNNADARTRPRFKGSESPISDPVRPTSGRPSRD